MYTNWTANPAFVYNVQESYRCTVCTLCTLYSIGLPNPVFDYNLQESQRCTVCTLCTLYSIGLPNAVLLLLLYVLDQRYGSQETFISRLKGLFSNLESKFNRRFYSKDLILLVFVSLTVKPLITNTSKEFIKCRILHFLIMKC